jgi:hypothetical protein
MYYSYYSNTRGVTRLWQLVWVRPHQARAQATPPPPAQWLAAQIRLLRRVVVGQGASWRILVAPLWATAASNTGSTPMGGKLSLDPTSAIAPPPLDADR